MAVDYIIYVATSLVAAVAGYGEPLVSTVWAISPIPYTVDCENATL